LLSDLVSNPQRLSTWEKLGFLYITAIRYKGVRVREQTNRCHFYFVSALHV
jgi:hypothetical protein